MKPQGSLVSVPRRIAAAALLLVCSSLTSANAGALPDIPVQGHALHRLGPVGAQGWGQTDVDGDGRPDLVTSSDGPAALILVYGRIEGSSALGLKQSLMGPPDSIAAIATAAVGDTRVVTVSPEGSVTRYGGWPLAPLGTFTVPPGTRLARIGDIDADGTLELLCARTGTLSVYALPNGEPKWSVSLPVTDIVIASLDADPALELIIAGGDSHPGYVMDGATRLLEWSRPQGFGTYLAAGRFGTLFEPGFVAARDWESLMGFSTAPYALDWSMLNSDTDGVAAGDTDADGRDELAVGDGQSGTVRIYDMPVRQMLYEMQNRGHGIWALGMIDFDADSRAEVWYSARIENSSNHHDNFAAALMNPITSRARLTIDSYRHGATASLFADLDRNGDQEWIIGTSSRSTSQGLLRVLDADTLIEAWRAPYEYANGFLPFQMVYRSLHAAQLDGDPALELVAVGGNGSNDFRFLVVDGITREVERQFPTPIDRISVEVTASRLVQHVPGGAPELLTASYVYGAPPANVKLDVYSLPDGDLIWSSARVGGFVDLSLGLDVGQLDADPSPEYLLVHTAGLATFDAASGQTQGQLAVETQGALIVASPSGPAILSFTTQGEVTRYDPATFLPLDSFALPPPLEKLARLPGRDDLLLAVSAERLKLINLDGRVLAKSDWIGSGPGIGDSLHAIQEGRGWKLSVGRSFTTFQLGLDDPDFIFAHGFQ